MAVLATSLYLLSVVMVGASRSADRDHAWVVGGLDQDNLDRVARLVDGAAGEGRDGMIGQGGLRSRQGPVEESLPPCGPTYVGGVKLA